MRSFAGLVIFVAFAAFGCGSAPTNNSNANRSNTSISNSNVSTSNMSNVGNTMTPVPSNLATNSSTNSKANNSATSNTSRSNTAASNTAVAGDKKIKGNKATKLYHLPGCPDYDKVSAGNAVMFETEQEARSAGYKLAGNCK